MTICGKSIQLIRSRLQSLATNLVLLALFLVVGCAPIWRKPAVDRSILTDDPCAAPCWHGIVPGMTTLAEAEDILRDLDFVDNDQVWRPSEGLAWHSRNCVADPGIPSRLRVHDNTVAHLDICVDCELSLQEVIGKYGPPAKYVAHMGPSSVIIQPYVHLFYPQRGLIFTLWIDRYDRPSEPLLLEPSTPVTWIRYFAPVPLENLMTDHPELKREILYGVEYWKDWPGYGPVELIR